MATEDETESGDAPSLPPGVPADTFCVLPWMHVSASVDGVWGRCCFDTTNDYDHYYRQAEEPAFELAPDALGCVPGSRYARTDPARAMTLLEVFNSPNLRRTRLQMLAGERPAACRSCFDQEDLGVTSHRISVQERFSSQVDIAGLITRTAPDGTLDGFPSYLDLRFGNTCNLSCVMCMFPVSSRLGAGRTPIWTTAVIDPYRHDAELWRILHDHAHEIRFLYLAGGEPFMQPGRARLIDLLVDSGAAPQIEVVYNSNLTILPAGALERHATFKSVTVFASCDGVDAKFEQIRVGARWDGFVANLRRARIHANLFLDVTVQRDNVADLRDLHEFAVAEGIPLRVENILQFPEELSARSLPRPERFRIAEGVAQLARECALDDPVLAGGLTRVRDYLLG